MSETANQPQESVEAGVHDQFLGIEPSMEDTAAVTTPQPSVAEEPAEAEATEAAVETEPAESAEAQSTDDWLEDLTQREVNYYKQRYPSAWEKLTDPDTPEDMKHLLRDKINSDRVIANSQTEDEEAESVAEGYDESDNLVDPEQVQQEATKPEQYYEKLQTLVQSRVNPQAVTDLGSKVATTLATAFGVDFSKLNDPNLPPEAKAELKAVQDGLSRIAPELGNALAMGAADLLSTLLPDLIPDATERAFPGSSQAYQRQTFTTAWESVRGLQEQDGTRPYESLPAFGTREFQEQAKSAAKRIAGSTARFDRMVALDDSGKPLAPGLQAQAKYEMLARNILNQKAPKTPPAVVAQAFDAGTKAATARSNKLANGKALGAGSSTKTFAGGDDALSELDKEIGIHNAGLNPFGKKR